MNALWILLVLAPVFVAGRKKEPICGEARPTPWPVNKVVPYILGYTKDKKVDFNVTDLSVIGPKVAEMEKNGFFKVGRQVVFIAHGFWNNEYFLWQYDIKDGIMKNDDSTVFVVSWGLGSIVGSYAQAASNTETVAKVMAELAEAILKTKVFNGDPNQAYFYCIGHSLGSHICGQAGRFSGHFDRITGLDPAGPGFESCWAEHSVRNDSALCVDHIHTDGSGKEHFDPVIPHYGSLFKWGHVDFYPNGGEAQSGCSVVTNDLTACSHMKAIDYFIFTVLNKNKCGSKPKCAGNKFNCWLSGIGSSSQQMGYFSSCYKGGKGVVPGDFELKTKGTRPYC